MGSSLIWTQLESKFRNFKELWDPELEKEKVRDAEYLRSFAEGIDISVENDAGAGKILFEIFLCKKLLIV